MEKTGRLLTDSSILYRCSQKYYDKVLDAYQLVSGQLPFLIFIYENEGITMNGLAQLGCYDKGTVTKGIQRLEEVGYVTIEVSPADKRVRTLRTTAKAKEIIGQIYLIRQQWWDQITQNMSEAEAALFEKLQSKAVANALDYLAEEEPELESVGIFGIQKMTLLDYPGKIASTLFTGGCNFRCPFSLVSLLLMVVSLLLEGNLYLSLSVLLFFAFYGFSALQLLYRAVTDQIVVIRGHCTGLEKTPMRRRIKTLYLWSDPHAVKIQIAGRLRNVDEGDIITVYTATGTPVYENEGYQQLSTYLAIDILKGRGSK